MDPKVIVIDGQTYHSLEEMPPDVRQKYEQAMQSLGDANGNRIPDAFENMNILADQNKNGVPDILENLTASSAIVNSMKIIVDGKEFNGVENLPPEVRAKYEAAMAKLDANQNGIPDFLEGTNAPKPRIKIATKINVHTSQSSDNSLTSTPSANHDYPQTALGSGPSAITPDTSNGWMLALLGLALLFVCALGAVGAWYFFLR
jgi:hypothetical protein